MAVLFTDNFNRANAADLGSNWQNADANWDLDTNTAEAQGNTDGMFVRTATAAHADTADVKVTATQGTTAADGGPLARCTAVGASPTAYVCDSYATDLVEIYRHNASPTGTLLRTATVTRVANGVIALEVSGTGATVTLKQYYQGTQRGADVNDTAANRLTTAGRTGLFNWIATAGVEDRKSVV